MASKDVRIGFGALATRSTRNWRRAVDRRLQPFGLTEATWLPLLRVARAETPMRQKDLAAALSLDGSSVVRLLDALQASGFVERREEEDRRAKTIVLTALGRRTVERVEWVAAQVCDEALGALGDDEVATAARVLDHICRVLEKADEEARA